MARVSASIFKVILSASLVFALSGCDFAETKSKFDDLLLHLIGRDDLIHPQMKGINPGTEVVKSAAEQAKENRNNGELLHEVFRVVLMREPAQQDGFPALLASLNQGSSFEGIYNGMTHSDIYRGLEEQNLGATPEALKAFATEMEVLQQEMDHPTKFTPDAAKPLGKAVQPDGTDGGPGAEPGDGVTTVDFNQPKIKALKGVSMSAEQISQSFVGASIFTLKRVFGDEALKLIDEKRQAPNGSDVLDHWYSKWVVHMASLHVDFGLPLRNKADENFHYDWAKAASEDALIWEVLNRVHRVVNQAHWKKP
jgi:hypothetical protein